jgi:hypothetical protein
MGKTMQPVILRYTWVRHERSYVPIFRWNEMVYERTPIRIFYETGSSTDFGFRFCFVF